MPVTRRGILNIHRRKNNGCIIADNNPARFYNTYLCTNVDVKRIFIMPFTRGCICMLCIYVRICVYANTYECARERRRISRVFRERLRFRGSRSQVESRVKHTSMLDACSSRTCRASNLRGIVALNIPPAVQTRSFHRANVGRIAENLHPLKLHPRAWDEGVMAIEGTFNFADHAKMLIINAHRWSVLLKCDYLQWKPRGPRWKTHSFRIGPRPRNVQRFFNGRHWSRKKGKGRQRDACIREVE
jgi:hypothetical protein